MKTTEERIESLLSAALTPRQLASFLDCDDSRDFPELTRIASYICAYLAQELEPHVALKPEQPKQYESWRLDDPRAADIGSLYRIAAWTERECWAEGGEEHDTCTRTKNHDGPHVAHVRAGIALAWWPQAVAADTEAA